MSSLPPYSESLLANETEPRTEGDHVPDDFKWSSVVAECAIDIRHAFIRRVYTILVVQILLTAAVGGVLVLNEGASQWALKNQWSLIVAVVGSISTMLLALWQQKRYPYNLCFLMAFTLFEGYLVGFASATYDSKVVVEAVVVTALVFSGLTVFAFQTKYDFTGLGPYLVAGLLGLFGFGFIALFTNSSGLEMAYSVIAVLIFSGFVLVDTQNIMARYDPESEVSAAITLYLDIINLFLNLLRVLNGNDDS